MENPNTWTQLHHDLNDIIKNTYNPLHKDFINNLNSHFFNFIPDLTNCLHRHGYNIVHQDDVLKEVKDFVKWTHAGEAGGSLPARLVFMAQRLQNI